MSVERVAGKRSDQPLEVIVHPLNGHLPPRRRPSGGVSGALKKRTRPGPWRAQKAYSYPRTGTAVLTDTGNLTRSTHGIHAAGPHPWWRASTTSVRDLVSAAANQADHNHIACVVTPLIGAGTGDMNAHVVDFVLYEVLVEHPSVTTHRVRRVLVIPQLPRPGSPSPW